MFLSIIILCSLSLSNNIDPFWSSIANVYSYLYRFITSIPHPPLKVALFYSFLQLCFSASVFPYFFQYAFMILVTLLILFTLLILPSLFLLISYFTSNFSPAARYIPFLPHHSLLL
jgi:hypothetical protein